VVTSINPLSPLRVSASLRELLLLVSLRKPLLAASPSLAPSVEDRTPQPRRTHSGVGSAQLGVLIPFRSGLTSDHMGA
jgi:hypothetical protein